jgi:hypothetical protein
MSKLVKGLAVAAVALGTSATPALANTRANAGSYINRNENLNLVPGTPTQFFLRSGVGVWMNCWTRGPSAIGQNKWFQVTVREGNGYGATGYVRPGAKSGTVR